MQGRQPGSSLNTNYIIPATEDTPTIIVTLEEAKAMHQEIEDCLPALKEMNAIVKRFDRISTFVAIPLALTGVFLVIPAFVGMVYHWFQPKKNDSILFNSPLDDMFGGLVRGFLYLPTKVASYMTSVKSNWDLEVIEEHLPVRILDAKNRAIALHNRLKPDTIFLSNGMNRITDFLQKVCKNLKKIIVGSEQQKTPASSSTGSLMKDPSFRTDKNVNSSALNNQNPTVADASLRIASTKENSPSNGIAFNAEESAHNNKFGLRAV